MALPGDPTFNQVDNPFVVNGYRKICRDFGIDPSRDFRYTRGDNHGLGSVYTDDGKTSASYPGGHPKFPDDVTITKIEGPGDPTLAPGRDIYGYPLKGIDEVPGYTENVPNHYPPPVD